MSNMDVVIDYAMVEEMSNTFGQAATDIEAVITEMTGVISMLEGGALLGDGGEALAIAIRDQLANGSLQRLKEKMIELQQETSAVVSIMRDGEQVRSRYFA